MTKKALFLDRDGIVNIDSGYVHKIEDFKFVDGIFDLCKYFQEKGFLIFIITNQSGIARGYYSEEDFNVLSTWMINEFKEKNIEITDIEYCPHHPTKGVGKYLKDCNCRKPSAGMILKLKDKYKIDLEKATLIGDRNSDIEAAINANILNTILIKSHYQDNYDFKSIRDYLTSISNISI